MSENNSLTNSEMDEEPNSTCELESEEEIFEDPCPEAMYYHDESMFSNVWDAVSVVKSVQHHDINYQFKAISEKRVAAEKVLNLQMPKIEEKRQVIAVFEDWLTEYREKNRQETNLDYLPIETIEAFKPLAKNYGLFMYDDFYQQYKSGNGDYTTLRTAKTNMDCWGIDTWDVVRNEWLESIINNMKTKNIGWYDWYTTDWCQDNKGLPSREHTRCILLGYSPDPEKLEELIPKVVKHFGHLDEAKNDDIVEEQEEKLNDSTDSDSEENKEEEKHIHNIECEVHNNVAEAIRTLKRLSSRDVTYQFQLIEIYHCRAKQLLKNNEDYLKEIQRCIKYFDRWFHDLRKTDGKETNKPYLPIETIEAFRPLAHSYGLHVYQCFYQNYKKVNGDYIALRTAKTNNCKCSGGEANWNVRRNEWLHELQHHDRTSPDYLYVAEDSIYKGFPTKGHVRMILLGYSPDPEYLQTLIPKIAGKFQLLENEESCIDSAYSPVGLSQEYKNGPLETLPPWKALKILNNVIKDNARCDIDFQFEMITYYRGCAKKLLKNQKWDLQRNIKMIKDFDEWLREYTENNREKELLPYLPLETVGAFRPLGRHYGITYDDFYEAYKAVDGHYKALRAVKVKPKNYHDEITWDIWRNDQLNHIIGKLDSNKRKKVVWYEVESSSGLIPSKDHVLCILLGYSPKPENLATVIPRISEICAQKKRVRETTPEAHCSQDDGPRKKIKTSSTSD